MESSTLERQERRWALRGCGVALVLVVVLPTLVLVHDFVSTPAWQSYPSGTAPNTVAHFLEDLQNGSLAAAYRLMEPGAGSSGRRSFGSFEHQFRAWHEFGHNIRFERVNQEAESASVVARIGTEGPGGLGSPGYTGWQRVTYRLIRRGVWRISGWKSRDLGAPSGVQSVRSPPS